MLAMSEVSLRFLCNLIEMYVWQVIIAATDNYTLGVVPGSHKDEIIKNSESNMEHINLSHTKQKLRCIDMNYGLSDIYLRSLIVTLIWSRYITLRKGQVLMMYASTIHCGGPSGPIVSKKAFGLQFADAMSSITDVGYHIYFIAEKPRNAKKPKLGSNVSVKNETHGVEFTKIVMVPETHKLSELGGQFVIE